MLAKVVVAVCLIAVTSALPDHLPSQGGYSVPEPPKQTYTHPAKPAPIPEPPKQTYTHPAKPSPIPEPPKQTYTHPAKPYPNPEPEKEKGMPFEYGYEVKDANSGIDFSHNTDSDGTVTKGEYRILLADGRIQTVKYISNGDEGYQAEVTYEGEAKFEDATKVGAGKPRQETNQPPQAYKPPQETSQPPQQKY